MPRLEDWFVTWGNRLCGKIYNDSRFEDGTVVTTSKLVTIDDTHAQTMNTEYELGRKANVG